MQGGLWTARSFDASRPYFDLDLAKVITGYNTDVEHDGVVYHVQTEDKGLESPLILSLVYAGGAILASKRSLYEDLIASGFSDEVLSERLRRQHRLICAAIHAGRLEELRRMSAHDSTSGAEAAVETPLPLPEQEIEEREPREATPPADEHVPVASAQQPPNHAAAYSVHDPRRRSPLGELPAMKEGLRLSLLDEDEFHAGDSLTLRIMVTYLTRTDEDPLSGAEVSVKVLGTTFRPQIYSMKTQSDGVATIVAQIPEFASGRAAILIRAVANGHENEIRRVIHPRN